MATQKVIQKAVGSWKGKSKLNLPWLPEDKRITKSESKLHVDLDMKHTFATITYTWVFEGKVEEGSMHICSAEKSKKTSIGWVDSWHQNSSVLHLTADEFNHDLVRATGSYPTGDGSPDWGWRIELSMPSDDTFLLKMINMPHGEKEEWAVEATYKRE
ncbi:MAG: DUF1579 family protein [Fimbriimonadaceae bacterium]|nr:DUF1579 family protein [Fimbriimonadaceae bacterium]